MYLEWNGPFIYWSLCICEMWDDTEIVQTNISITMYIKRFRIILRLILNETEENVQRLQ